MIQPLTNAIYPNNLMNVTIDNNPFAVISEPLILPALINSLPGPFSPTAKVLVNTPDVATTAKIPTPHKNIVIGILAVILGSVPI